MSAHSRLELSRSDPSSGRHWSTGNNRIWRTDSHDRCGVQNHHTISAHRNTTTGRDGRPASSCSTRR